MAELGLSPVMTRVIWFGITFLCVVIFMTLLAASDDREESWRPTLASSIALHGYFALQLPTNLPGNIYGVLATGFAACLGIPRLRSATIRLYGDIRMAIKEVVFPAIHKLTEPYLPGAAERREEERRVAEEERKRAEKRKAEADRKQEKLDAELRRREVFREQYSKAYKEAEAQGRLFFYVGDEKYLTAEGLQQKREEHARRDELEARQRREAECDRALQAEHDERRADELRPEKEERRGHEASGRSAEQCSVEDEQPSVQAEQTPPEPLTNNKRKRIYPKL